MRSFLLSSPPFNARHTGAFLTLFYRWLDSEDGNQQLMLRCNGLIRKGFVISDGGKMSVSYENIVDLHFTIHTIKGHLYELYQEVIITLR